MRLKLTSKYGTVVKTFADGITSADFILLVEADPKLTDNKKVLVIGVQVGFLSRAIDIQRDSRSLEDIGITNGSKVRVEFDSGGSASHVPEVTTAISNADKKIDSERKIATTKAESISRTEMRDRESKNSDIALLYIKEFDSYLILRNIPDDNSCLFNSISYAMVGYDSFGADGVSPPGQLRQVVAEHILSHEEVYDEAVLGRPVADYVNWIQKKDSWGGAIELGILSQWFNVTILCLDIESDKYITFDASENPRGYIILVYSGIHYDVLAQNEQLLKEDFVKKWDTTLWPAENQAIKEYGQQMGALLQSKDYSTNTTKFRVRCLDCYEVLVGEMGASRHANQTGHYNFGEVR